MSKNDGPCKVKACDHFGKRSLGLCPKHYMYFFLKGITEPPAHKPKRMPVTQSDARWLAGVIDCEGWIGLTRAKRPGRDAYSVGIGVGNTNRLLIDELVRLTNMGKTSTRTPRMPNAKDKHMWEIYRYEDVRNFCVTIRPFLLLKIRQADIILSLPPKNSKNNAVREAAWTECCRLNKKGRH